MQALFVSAKITFIFALAMMEKKLFIETYGCQMNVYDSELAASILEKEGYKLCDSIETADLILINTCSVRENAEQRVWGRLDRFLAEKKKRKVKVGILGCMAERLKDKLFSNKAVDFVAGPDALRTIPQLLRNLEKGERQINVHLSCTETYADIEPVKKDKNGVSTFISIMRGCNNRCTYCIVPYVRGIERSRDPHSIVKEAENLYKSGYKEMSLLGQNVDSYLWRDPVNPTETVNFAQLLKLVALTAPDLRVRYATSHPKDMGDDVLYTMAAYPNICRHIHLPVQSGSNAMLAKMNRKYTIENYLERISKIREIIPEAAVTTDIIAGFCSETEEDHQATLELMKKVRFDSAFMFQYSERPGTKAAREYPDDVPQKTKTRRLNEIIELQNKISLGINQKCIGKVYQVLIEGFSKRDREHLFGRTSGNKICIFPPEGHKRGEYVDVKIDNCTSATLIAHIVK